MTVPPARVANVVAVAGVGAVVNAVLSKVVNAVPANLVSLVARANPESPVNRAPRVNPMQKVRNRPHRVKPMLQGLPRSLLLHNSQHGFLRFLLLCRLS